MAVNAEPALLTFLIADVRGYTRFTVERGDEAAARLATTFAALTTSAVEPAGGRVIELRGDEALAVFPSARQALRAAVTLQKRFSAETREDLPLRVGIGVDAGEAIPVGGGYRGAALNLAARLCSLAGPGEVLTSETVTNLARKLEGLSYEERGAAELKGFSAPVMVMRVLEENESSETVREAVVEEEQRLPIGGFLGALPFNPLVARQTELDRVLEAIRAVQGSGGRVVLLTGEPGVGKTRLAQEATLHARNGGFLVASGRCYEPEESVPYYPFREALSMLYEAAPPALRADVPRLWPYLLQLLPGQVAEGPRGGSGDEEQQRLFYAVTGFIAAVSAVQPVALLLDDLHWADGSSLKMLQYIARHTRTNPVFILATYRDVEVGRQHPLERALRDLNREGLTEEIAVRRLDREGTAALTAATFGESEVSPEFAELLHRHTEGNPFYTHEVLRALVERGDVYEENGRWERRKVEEIEVPKSVRSTVGERVSRLDDEAQEILTEASVLGQTFEFEDLMAVGERGEKNVEDALGAAEASGIVRPQGRDSYAFNHALTQQVLYEELSPRRRRRLHLAAGEAIEAAKHPERRVAELAWHFLQGDDAEKALPYAIRAGDEAEAVFAHGEAARHYRNALELARELGERRAEMETLEKLGTVLGIIGVFDEAVQRLKDADRLARELGDREVQRRAVAEAADLTSMQHLEDEDLSRRFDDLAADDEPSPGLARIYLVKGRRSFGEGRYAEAEALATRMGEIARAIGSDYLLADAEMRLATGVAHRNRDQGIAALEQARDLAERSGNVVALALTLNNLAFQYMLRGDLEKNLHYRLRSMEQAQRHQSVIGHMWTQSMMAQAHHFLGDLAAARGYAETAVGVARATERIWHTAYALFVLAHVQVLAGEWDEAAPLLEEGRALSESYGDLQGLAYARDISGELALFRGDPASVVEAYERAEDGTVQWERWSAATAYLELGDNEATEKVLGDMLREGGIAEAAALRLRGMMAARRGDEDAADRDLTQALEIARKQKYRQEEGLALHELGVLLLTRGNHEGARQRLSESLRLFRDMGAHAYADRTERILGELLSR